MSQELEGPHPEKRLTDLVQLAAAFVPALEAYEAKRYPDQPVEDGAYDGIAEALHFNTAQIIHRGNTCDKFVGTYMMDCMANDVIVAAVNAGRVPSVFEHRVAVMSMHRRWPMGGPFDMAPYRLHPTWPPYVISSHGRGFCRQTEDIVARWADQVAKHLTHPNDMFCAAPDQVATARFPQTVDEGLAEISARNTAFVEGQFGPKHG